MPDYREMYYILFRETAKAISILQNAQRKTEEMYLSEPKDPYILIQSSQKSDEGKSYQNIKHPEQDI